MERNELHKLMDCCRPDQSDLGEPELAALAEALSRDPQVRAEWEARRAWDVAVQEAMNHVEVPAGLAERLVAHVEQAGGARGVQTPNEEVPEESRADEPVEFDRRRWLTSWPAGVAAAFACTAALLAIVAWLGPWGDSLTGTQVAELARQWATNLDQESWQDAGAPLDQYPLDPSLRFVPTAWQQFAALEDSRAVVYSLQLPPDRARAYLFVVRTRRGRHLGTFPPSVPDSTTQGVCVGVWKSNGLLYVLLVPGSQRQYRRLMSTQAFA